MWILSRVNNDDKCYLLCDQPKYTVGRNKNCDIVGESTQSSLGRLHATLHPYEDRVEVIDTESKYGTYINDGINLNEKINPKTRQTLKDGDTIRFGFIDFTWKLEKTNIVALSSTLTDSEKDDLKKHISTLGGQTINQWSDTCTHLVVKNLTFTVKVLQALCHAIPIVKPEYFKAMLLSIRNKSLLPNVDNFQPHIVERLVANSELLRRNINRKRLFAGKTFVFMKNKEMETFRGIIECAMGKCSSLDTQRWQRRSLVKSGCIVVNSTSGATQSQVATQVVDELSDFLRSKGCRMVPDSEISLAILHCSLEKFCNPNHTLKDIFDNNTRIVPTTSLVGNTPVDRNEVVASSSVNSINVPETNEQPNTFAASVPSNSIVINLMDDDDDLLLVQGVDLAMSTAETRKGKRKLSSDDCEPSTKKPHVAQSVDIMVDSHRRSTRSAAKNHTTKPATENRTKRTSTVQQKKELATERDACTSTSHTQSLSNLLVPQIEITEKNSTEMSIIEYPKSQKRVSSTKSFQSECVTSTQIESYKRKRIAHRPNSTFANINNSDSDDELFNFNTEPSMKKSKPTKDSDSDDQMSHPVSNRPLPLAYVPSQSFTQPITSDSWLSRPTPSQASNNTRIRSKSNKKNPVENPKSANVSAGWQIGKFCISSRPVQVPTQGWFSKSTIGSNNLKDEMKLENSNENINDVKWDNSLIHGIQVITKSMNLISTSGKVFKKQRFIAPTEIIKTTKVYEF